MSNVIGKKAYIAGPMRGKPFFNFPRFMAIENALRSWGADVVFNPAAEDIRAWGGVDHSKFCPNGAVEELHEHLHRCAAAPFSMRSTIHADLSFITLHAQLVVFLPGWESSPGARAEHATAVFLIPDGMQLEYLSEEECQQLEEIYHEVTED